MTAAVLLPAFTSAPAQAAPAVLANGGTLPSPTGLKAVRDRADLNDFTVSWRPVAGATRYNVSVLAKGVDRVVTVAAPTTSLAVTGVDLSTVYRITVSSRDAAGRGSTSGPVFLYGVYPGAPTEMKLSRDPKGTSMTASWATPKREGWTPVSSYEYTVTQLSTTKVIAEGVTKESTLALADLDPLRQYVLRVRAVNAQGSGPAAIGLLGNDRPASPPRPQAARDVNDPGIVTVTFAPPTYAGYAPIDFYEVLSGIGSLRQTTKVAVDQRTASVAIDPTRIGVVAVRGCSAAGCGQISSIVQIPSVNAIPSDGRTASTSALVDVQQTTGKLRVEINGSFGTPARYPQLVVRVVPTVANGGFSEEQWGQNGAQVMTFEFIPKGTYTVVVGALDTAGKETELARKVVVVGDDGALQQANWKLIFGRATITGNVVDMPFSGENRVMSTLPRTSTDMVLTTRATLRFGWGYGVWFRAGLNANGRMDGYTFQYDPMFGNKFIIRHWSNGTECGTPLAQTPFPAGFAENAPHQLVVVAKGDTVWATVDGREIFRVPSLKAAIAASPCKYPAPTGTGIGFRTWSNSSAIFEGTTLS